MRAALLLAVLLAGCSQAETVTSATPIPDFTGRGDVGWIAMGDTFQPAGDGPGPVMADPEHPRVTNAQAVATGQPPSFHIGDADSPILQPWAKAVIAKRNAETLSGIPGYTRAVACWPLGVPAFVLGMVQPIYFVQTPKLVLLIWQEGSEVRHVYMDQPHSAHVAPSWFGESIGHYEGDTLVIDTIGLNGQTYIDHFRTPHSDRLHVVERYRMTDGGKMLEVRIHVDDPGAFTASWDAVQRLRRADQGPMLEASCAENNTGFFNQKVEPMPEAGRADF
jgi:hypothetical protein